MADLFNYNDEELSAIFKKTSDTDPARLAMFRRLNSPSSTERLIFGYRGVKGFDIVTRRNAIIFAILVIFISAFPSFGAATGAVGLVAMAVIAIMPLFILTVLPLMRLTLARPLSTLTIKIYPEKILLQEVSMWVFTGDRVFLGKDNSDVFIRLIPHKNNMVEMWFTKVARRRAALENVGSHMPYPLALDILEHFKWLTETGQGNYYIGSFAFPPDYRSKAEKILSNPANNFIQFARNCSIPQKFGWADPAWLRLMLLARGEDWPPAIITGLGHRTKNILREGELLLLRLPLFRQKQSLVLSPGKTSDLRGVHQPGPGGQIMLTTDRIVVLDAEDIPLDFSPYSKIFVNADHDDWVINLPKSQFKLPRAHICYPLEVIPEIMNLKNSVAD